MNQGADQLQDDCRAALRETIEAKEAAAILGVSEWTIYDLVRRRIVPHIKISRRILFRRTSLLAWLEAQEQASVAADPAPERNKIRRLK